jgi:hypothetical protein
MPTDTGQNIYMHAQTKIKIIFKKLMTNMVIEYFMEHK